MQERFDFVASDLARWRSRLVPLLNGITVLPRRKPIGQLVKSLISGRTKDAVSLAAYRKLGQRFGSAAALGAASPTEVEYVIHEVNFADAKAGWLVAALRQIGQERPDYQLSFLGDLSLSAALEWLERLPGVGRKVAASTLNASTLARPVFIVDTHVLRVLRRLGFIAANAETRAASEAVTGSRPDWSADDFLLFHIVVKRLGQLVCTFDTPQCGMCPLLTDCPTARRSRN